MKVFLHFGFLLTVFLGPAIWRSGFGYVSVWTFDLLDPGQQQYVSFQRHYSLGLGEDNDCSIALLRILQIGHVEQQESCCFMNFFLSAVFFPPTTFPTKQTSCYSSDLNNKLSWICLSKTWTEISLSGINHFIKLSSTDVAQSKMLEGVFGDSPRGAGYWKQSWLSIYLTGILAEIETQHLR